MFANRAAPSLLGLGKRAHLPILKFGLKCHKMQSALKFHAKKQKTTSVLVGMHFGVEIESYTCSTATHEIVHYKPTMLQKKQTLALA